MSQYGLAHPIEIAAIFDKYEQLGEEQSIDVTAIRFKEITGGKIGYSTNFSIYLKANYHQMTRSDANGGEKN